MPTADIVGAVGKMRSLAVMKVVFVLKVAFIFEVLFIFPTAPTMSAVGKEPHLSFSFFHIQGTSIGLAVTNHALLSLVDTNLA